MFDLRLGCALTRRQLAALEGVVVGAGQRVVGLDEDGDAEPALEIAQVARASD